MKNKHIFIIGVLFAGAIIIGPMGCSPAHHAGEVQKGLQGDKVTVGTVQREIKVGMSSAAVVQVLGSPNVVTTDEQRRRIVNSKSNLFLNITAPRPSSKSVVGSGVRAFHYLIPSFRLSTRKLTTSSSL